MGVDMLLKITDGNAHDQRCGGMALSGRPTSCLLATRITLNMFFLIPRSCGDRISRNEISCKIRRPWAGLGLLLSELVSTSLGPLRFHLSLCYRQQCFPDKSSRVIKDNESRAFRSAWQTINTDPSGSSMQECELAPVVNNSASA